MAATLYASIAVDNFYSETEMNLSELTMPAPVIWPGISAWRISTAPTPYRGFALLMGSASFPKDGTITQIPQTTQDLKEFASYLQKKGYETHLLLNENFTKKQLESTIEIIKKEISNTGRPFLCCFCGHGFFKNNQYYLLTNNTTMKTITETSINATDWLETIKELQNDRTIVLLNSCYSDSLKVM